MTLLAVSLSLLLLPQDLELSGRVTDRSGTAVVGAQVELAPLPLSPVTASGMRSSYKLAMASQRLGAKMPRTVTDRDGEWRMLLAPQQAALAAAEAVEMELVVRAPEHATWRRAIGPSWLAANQQVAILEPLGPGLDLQLEGGTGAYLGFALVERPFRVPGGRSVWLQDLLEVPGNGRIRFAEPPRVPGEADAPSPTARLEAYRVTLYCADLDPLITFVTAGTATRTVKPTGTTRRRILKERAELVPGPITATWLLARQSLELRFESARVPLLGGEAPVAIQTSLGPVALDGWDADQPLFLRNPADTTASDPAPAGAAEGPFGTITVAVQRKEQPVFGAGVWIEDAAAKRSGPGATLYAMTDPSGQATLQGIPAGSWRMVVRHVTLGQKESLVSTPANEPIALVLGKREPTDARPVAAPLPGSLLLDLGAVPVRAGHPAIEIGVLGPDNRLVRKSFEDSSRFMRLDGLVPGPTSLYVKVGSEPPILVGGLLAQSVREPAHDLTSVAKRVVRLHVRDSSGAAATAVKLSLGEVAPSGKEPASLGLLAARPAGQPGMFTVEARAYGSINVRVHGLADERVDVAFPGTGDLLDLRLAPAPVAPTDAVTSRRSR